MPPRHTYWTIILEGTPTAFRAHTQEELLPTLKQLQARHPDAVLKWFARGRLWHSPEEEKMAADLKRRGPGRERRGPQWRPGGGLTGRPVHGLVACLQRLCCPIWRAHARHRLG